MTQIVEEAGKCELCGSRRGLEAHHIIPLVCGGEDVEDNLICVCQCCHTLLTPRSLLTKLGIKKTKERNAKIVESSHRIIEDEILKNSFKLALYEKIEEYIAIYGPGSATLYDAIEDL